MTAGNGEVVWSAKYNSFGEAEVELASTIENNLRFAGQYEDTETGLYYNQYRYYNAAIGRFLRIDPVKQEINNYLYVESNPINLIDPLGLQIVDPRDFFPGINSPYDIFRRLPGAQVFPKDINNPTGNAVLDCTWKCFVKKDGLTGVMLDLALLALGKGYPICPPPGWVIALFTLTEGVSTYSTIKTLENCTKECSSDPNQYGNIMPDFNWKKKNDYKYKIPVILM